MAAAATKKAPTPATTLIHVASLATAMNPKNATITTSATGNGGCSMAPTYGQTPTPASVRDATLAGRLSAVTTPAYAGLPEWIEGARPRTLPAAIAPVLAGTGAAALDDGVVWWKALLALGVSLSLQIGVNYANDYSDGIRGTDDD